MERKALLAGQSAWMKGNDSPVVLSSRIRLARNVENYPFPHRLSQERALELEKTIGEIIGEMQVEGQNFHYLSLAGLSEIEQQVLIEKHLISPALTQGGNGRGVGLTDDHRMAAMVNEEDHLRLQVLLPGARLTEAYQLAGVLDDTLEDRLDFAFRPAQGYLTACPTNVGTGMRASVMVHLPGLAMTQQVQPILGVLTQLGLAVRGLYGEGSQAYGHIFQISNQITLGKSEEDILAHLDAVTGQIVGHEMQAREGLRLQTGLILEDKVWRARGILQNARLLTSEDALQFLSQDCLGTEMGILPQGRESFVTLMVNSRPGCLQYALDRELEPGERDEERARLIRLNIAPIGCGDGTKKITL